MSEDYERYKAEWLLEHTTEEQRLNKLKEFKAECNGTSLYDFDEWLLGNNGFNGECYACYEEWKNNERKNDDECL